MALKYHPQRNKGNIAENTYKFSQIAEAYEVLSCPIKKGIFDQYGELILKEGMPGNTGKSHCYKYAGNALEIFEMFFGTDNPIPELSKSYFNKIFVFIGIAEDLQKVVKAPDNIYYYCECTLKELYIGCTKDITYERIIVGLDGKTTENKAESFVIEIKPGYSKDSLIQYPGRGNEAYSFPTCNINNHIK